jgi:hypothetical protein
VRRTFELITKSHHYIDMTFGHRFHGYRSPKALDILLPFLLLAILYDCSGPRNDTAGETSSGDDETVPLPRSLSPTGLFTTNSPLLVIKAAGGAYHRSLYSWYSDKSQEEIVTLNGQKLISPPLTLPNGGPTGWGACEGDLQYIVCVGDRPGMSVEDKDYDEMGFTAILVVSLTQRKTNWFPVKHRTRIRFDPQRKMIYAVDRADESAHAPVAVYDLAGKERGSGHLSDLMPLSPSGRFVESLQEDGADSWEVYEADSRKVLLTFNCDRPECKEGDRNDHQWNPKFTDQLIAIRSSAGKDGACDVYMLSPPHLKKTLPCGGLPVYDWSRDGRELVTLQYEGNIFRREPVN